MWATTLTGNGLYIYIPPFYLCWFGGWCRWHCFTYSLKSHSAIFRCEDVGLSIQKDWAPHQKSWIWPSMTCFFFPGGFLTKSRVTKKQFESEFITHHHFSMGIFFQLNSLEIQFIIYLLLAGFFLNFFKSWWEFVIGNPKTNLSWKPNSKPIMWGWLKWHP